MPTLGDLLLGRQSGGLLDLMKQYGSGVKQRVGLLADDPTEFARQALLDVVPNRAEAQAAQARVMGGSLDPQAYAGYIGKMQDLSGLLGSLQVAKTPFEIAHEVAQRNAALPVEQGGLGLPPNNTAIDRARAMGFVDAYHGSNREVSPSFDMSMLGENTGAQSARKAVFAAADPHTPHAYIWGSKEASTDWFGASIAQKADSLKAGNPSITDAMARYMAREQLNEEFAAKLRELNRNVSNNSRGGFRRVESEAYKNAVKDLNGFLAQNEFLTRGFNVIDDAAAMDLADAGGMFGGQFVPHSAVSSPAPNIMPLMIRANDLPQSLMRGAYRDTSYADVLDYAIKHGSEGAVIRNTTDGGPVTDIFAVSNPSRIRSRFAAFDPTKRDSADLLASVAPYAISGSLLGLLGLSPDDARAGK